jgi:endonuclease/exonuclease/phosphatase family metal-dependent hydrolase
MLRKTMAAAAVGGVSLATALTMAPAQAALSMGMPTGVHVTILTPTTMSLRWTAVAGASAYRLQMSTSPSMTSSRYFDFQRNAGAARGLTPRSRYYYRVAVISTAGARLSAYTASGPSASTTAVGTPTALSVVSTTTSSASLSWTASEGASLYRVATSTSPDFTAPTYTTSATSSATLPGLFAGTSYYFQVQVVAGDGAPVTPYSTAVPGRTASKPGSSGGSDVRVGSFNVMTASGDQTVGNRLPWAGRRAAVVGQILGEKVDVIGVQEVNQSYGLASRMVDGANQFLDLKNGLNSAGGTYALTNETSYNCVNPKSSYKCVYQYRGASGGDRIYYNTSTLSMVSQGAYAYPTQNPDTVATVTYALAYAVFEVKSTGTRFLFTTTHLDPPNRTVRVAQWNELIAKVNQMKGDMPVVNVGDYNTQKFDVITQEMLPKMKAAGYGDVLNQSYATNPATVVRAQSTVNGWVNSLNRYDRDVRNYSYPGNYTKTGNSIDWIFASNSLPVRQFKMVSDFDPDTLQVQGVMPSDHNMERATLTMP